MNEIYHKLLVEIGYWSARGTWIRLCSQPFLKISLLVFFNRMDSPSILAIKFISGNLFVRSNFLFFRTFFNVPLDFHFLEKICCEREKKKLVFCSTNSNEMTDRLLLAISSKCSSAAV